MNLPRDPADVDFDAAAGLAWEPAQLLRQAAADGPRVFGTVFDIVVTGDEVLEAVLVVWLMLAPSAGMAGADLAQVLTGGSGHGSQTVAAAVDMARAGDVAGVSAAVRDMMASAGRDGLRPLAYELATLVSSMYAAGGGPKHLAVIGDVLDCVTTIYPQLRHLADPVALALGALAAGHRDDAATVLRRLRTREGDVALPALIRLLAATLARLAVIEDYVVLVDDGGVPTGFVDLGASGQRAERRPIAAAKLIKQAVEAEQSGDKTVLSAAYRPIAALDASEAAYLLWQLALATGTRLGQLLVEAMAQDT